ncbi:hypothetical protein GA0070563_102119 [Micromonospora carbonacea]|uniref:Uncharacterized protein n=1 Tax=Micromonospora carbonacea TaxID=47853 RepID=A0A1C4V9D2_9ACTN|nr:hypothetical protein GA0070563_102119 [Micromonospora carbonacea]
MALHAARIVASARSVLAADLRRGDTSTGPPRRERPGQSPERTREPGWRSGRRPAIVAGRSRTCGWTSVGRSSPTGARQELDGDGGRFGGPVGPPGRKDRAEPVDVADELGRGQAGQVRDHAGQQREASLELSRQVLLGDGVEADPDRPPHIVRGRPGRVERLPVVGPAELIEQGPLVLGEEVPVPGVVCGGQVEPVRRVHEDEPLDRTSAPVEQLRHLESDQPAQAPPHDHQPPGLLDRRLDRHHVLAGQSGDRQRPRCVEPLVRQLDPVQVHAAGKLPGQARVAVDVAADVVHRDQHGVPPVSLAGLGQRHDDGLFVPGPDRAPGEPVPDRVGLPVDRAAVDQFRDLELRLEGLVQLREDDQRRERAPARRVEVDVPEEFVALEDLRPDQVAAPRRGTASTEPFSSWVAVGFDVVQNEDGLHDRGRSPWAAAQLGQDFPGLEGGDRAFTAGADRRVGAVHGLLPV